MVSKKKRPPPALESNETNSKKSKLHDAPGTSNASASVISEPGAVSKRVIDEKMKSELDQDIPVLESNSGGNYAAFPQWPQADLLELMRRMEGGIPAKDNLSFSSRAEKLDWHAISFGDHSAQDCKETWSQIQKRLRKFRLLKEVLEDAKVWVSKPWTNFYRSQKQNRHPDMPRRPLSSYMLFYMDKKDKVAKENPGLEMTAISKYIAELYKTLPVKKKQKYSELAARERKEYEEKLDQFYQEHPELIPKQHEKSEGARSSVEVGPKRPKQPFKLFFEDKLKRHKNDVDFDRSSFLEKCKEQWRNMPDKKKVIWINWALEEETRYTEELKAYMSENPEFVPTNVRTVLTKEEKSLRERVAGKPEKPPNSGYSLFSRLMLASDHIKDIAPKKRMMEISRLWKCLQEVQKKKYQEQVNHMLDQYKLEYATYLESLPEDKRQEELQSSMPRPRRSVPPPLPQPQPPLPAEDKQKKTFRNQKCENPLLYKGEPELPPRNEFQLFAEALQSDRSYSEKEAHQLWQMLPETDKAKYRKKLKDTKTKYIEDYEKFLNRLTQEELKDYSAKKESSKKENADLSEESDQEVESNESSEDENSGSEDSSSESDTESSDSSESNDGKNSEDSSSNISDSD